MFVCQLLLYPSTAVWDNLYHDLLNASLCLIQISLSNSPFSLKSACFEYVPILDLLSYQDLYMIALPGLIISILFCCRITYSILAHFIWSVYTIKSFTQNSTTYKLTAASSFLYGISMQSFFHTVVVLLITYGVIVLYCGSDTIYLHRYSSILW
jgi:hypothetical protein